MGDLTREQVAAAARGAIQAWRRSQDLTGGPDVSDGSVESLTLHVTDAVMGLLAGVPRILSALPGRDDLLGILAGLADGSRPGHNTCPSCTGVMRRTRVVLLALYDVIEDTEGDRDG